jgi:hypothetical protein
MTSAAPSKGESQLTILRNGEKKTIKVQLKGDHGQLRATLDRKAKIKDFIKSEKYHIIESLT